MNDTALALRLLLFCFEHLPYPLCPRAIPDIEIDPDLDAEGRIEFGFLTTIKLRAWDGSAYWQSVLCHETAHYVQAMNGVTFSDTRKTEREALSAQVSWLIKINAPIEAYPTEKIIHALTGNRIPHGADRRSWPSLSTKRKSND